MTLQTIVGIYNNPPLNTDCNSYAMIYQKQSFTVNFTVKVQTFSGSNGGGSLVAVTTLIAKRVNWTDKVLLGSITGNGANTTTSAGTAGAVGKLIVGQGNYNNGSQVGSLVITISYDNADGILQALVRRSGSWVWPTDPIKIRRSGVWVPTGFRVRRSGVWVG